MDIVRHLEMSTDREYFTQLQEKYAQEVCCQAEPNFRPKFLAAADVCYGDDGKKAYAAVVVIDLQNAEVVEKKTWQGAPEYHYQKGLFALREVPCLLKTFTQLSTIPDIIVVDGNGILHPRGFGLACHIGLTFDIPTIGCAKSLLLGSHPPVSKKKPFPQIKYQGNILGIAVKIEKALFYVSIGHKVDLETAKDIIVHLPDPSPLTIAHNICSQDYHNDREKKDLEKKEALEKIIQIAKDLKSKGISYSEVAKEMNNSGYQHPSGKKFTPRKIRNWLQADKNNT